MFGLQLLFHGQSFQVVIPKSVETCKDSLVSHVEIQQRGTKGVAYEFSSVENEGYHFWFHERVEGRVLLIFKGLLQEQDNNTTMVTATAYIPLFTLIGIIPAIIFAYLFRYVILLFAFYVIWIYGVLFTTTSECARAEEIFVDLAHGQARKQKT